MTENEIISFNIGDSRAILAREEKALDLTTEHKPSLPSEMDRLRKLGGKISWRNRAWRINTLSVSRALGDKADLPFISAEPDIVTINKDKKDSFIVIACDGLWDVMTSQECVDLVRQKIKAGTQKDDMAEALVKEALSKYTNDNVSVVVLWLD